MFGAKYAGRCRTCQEPINVGDPIRMLYGKARHEACCPVPEQLQPAVDPDAEARAELDAAADELTAPAVGPFQRAGDPAD